MVLKHIIAAGSIGEMYNITAYWYTSGSHPDVVDGIVNRTACVLGIHGYCDKVYGIQIKACNSGEYVYYLRQPQSCNEGYCFGMYHEKRTPLFILHNCKDS